MNKSNQERIAELIELRGKLRNDNNKINGFFLIMLIALVCLWGIATMISAIN
jgi:hypothetical protein